MTEPHDDSAPAAWAALGPLMDLVTPMALRVAATLRIADLIGDGAVGVDVLAERSGTDADALARLLRHLVARGVFAEPEPGKFTTAGPARFLRSDHPSGMHTSLDLDGFGGRMDLAFTGLLHSVRTGEPAWETVFGKPFWRYLADEPHVGAAFDATMAAGPEYIADAAAGYDWTSAPHVVDVGGGVGALLALVLRGNPGLRATLVDLPDTVRRGGEYLAERGLAGRCRLVGQSFFDPLPTGGDVYMLGHVLHDWPDGEATAILRRCAEAAGDRGRVVVIEGPATPDSDPASFAEMNLRMLVLAGGRQRTPGDYRALAGAAGLRVTDVRTTPLGHIVIECVSR
jgi:O-methyltransferase